MLMHCGNGGVFVHTIPLCVQLKFLVISDTVQQNNRRGKYYIQGK